MTLDWSGTPSVPRLPGMNLTVRDNGDGTITFTDGRGAMRSDTVIALDRAV